MITIVINAIIVVAIDNPVIERISLSTNLMMRHEKRYNIY
jgi:hypothetical protein